MKEDTMLVEIELLVTKSKVYKKFNLLAPPSYYYLERKFLFSLFLDHKIKFNHNK